MPLTAMTNQSSGDTTETRHSATSTSTESDKGEQYIVVHVRLDNNQPDVVHRILHTSDISVEDVNQSLRYLIPALEGVQICLADADGTV